MKKLLFASTALTMIIASPVAADPITLAVAAASTASAAFAAGGVAAMTFTLGSIALTGWGAVAAQFAIRAALGYALNALAPKPKQLAAQGYTVNSLGPANPCAVIYGEAVVGGSVFYQAVSGASNRYFHRCIAFAAHEIQSFEAIYFDGEEVTLDGSGNVTAPAQYNGHARVKEHLGASNQSADSDLVSEVTEWTSLHRAKGIAYLYIRFDHDTSAYPNGLPTVTAKIRGKKVYDPRTGAAAWSDNPALCLRDYLINDYGLSETSSQIDDDRFEAAANICDNVMPDPEADATADLTKSDGDTVTAAEFDDDANFLVVADVTPDGTNGVIWEQGGDTYGAYLGVTSGDFVFRWGGAGARASTDVASVASSAAAYNGTAVTLFGYANIAEGTARLWVYESDGTLTELGEGTASSPASQWTDSDDGAIGQQGGTHIVTGEDATSWTGTIDAVRFYQGSEPIPAAGVTGDRFTCSGSFTLDNTHGNVIQGLLTSMGGMFWYAQGQWGCKAANYTNPALHLDIDDITGELNVATRNSRRDNYNSVRGTYLAGDDEWQVTDFSEVTDSDFVTEDGGAKIHQDLQLPFTTTDAMAQRIAKIALRRNRQQTTVTTTYTMEALNALVGDTVTLTADRYGWGQKVFEVADWRFGVNDQLVPEVTMMLREIDATVFL